jgi:hypothetical protein
LSQLQSESDHRHRIRFANGGLRQLRPGDCDPDRIAGFHERTDATQELVAAVVRFVGKLNYEESVSEKP